MQKRSNRVWRRRQCLKCRAIFSTQEEALFSAAWVVQANNGTLASFSRDKLFLSLYKSCEHRPKATEDAAALTDTVINKLTDLAQNSRLTAPIIAQVAQVVLSRFDKAASTHYQAFHRT